MTGTPGGDPLARRPFGPTGLEVSPLCLGCAPLGDMPRTFAYSVPEERALATIRALLDSPINFLDTAASYGEGESERRIGLVLRERGGLPPVVVLATKADRDPTTGDFSGDQMRRSVERSLRLLGLDRLQVVYLHDPEHTTFENVMSPGGPLEVLQRLKEEGLIRHLGVAGGPIDMSIRYVETGAFEAVITHNRYTLLNRSADPLLTLAAERGLAVVNAAPYGSGMLAKGPDAYPRYAYQDAPSHVLEQARRMADLCARHGVPLAAAALQFSLRDPRVTSTIVGMTQPERVEQTIALAQYPIPDDLWPQLDAIFAAAPTGADPEANRWQRG
jgi:D-threo-aldose 1-dehydrogenase